MDERIANLLETDEERRRRLRNATLTSAPGNYRPEPWAPPASSSQTLSPVAPVDPIVSSADSVRANQGKPNDITPVGDLMGKYDNWMGRRPKYEDHKPSVGRGILAGVVGALASLGNNAERGAKAAEAIAYEKWNRAKEDWEGEGKALKDIQPLVTASERVGATNERTEAMRYGTDVRAETADEDRVVRKQKNENDLRVALERSSGEDEDRAALAQYRKERTAIERGQLGVSQRNAATNERNAETAAKNPGRTTVATTESEPSPNEEADEEFNIAQEVVRANPQWAKYLDEDGNIKLPTVGAWWGNTNVDDYKKFNDAIESQKRNRPRRRTTTTVRQ